MPFLSFLLAVATVLGDTGNIFIRAEPGLTVYLDGAYACVTSAEESGCVLSSVKVGEHEVRVEMPGGPSSVMQVEVIKDEVTTVTMSALALRSSAKKGGLELQMPGAEAKCVAAVTDRTKPFIDGWVAFYELAPGGYDIEVGCGQRIMNGRVNIPPGRIVVAEVNLTTKAVRVLGDRARTAQRLTIPSSRDKIESAPLPAEAKRALMASLGSGVTVLDLQIINSAMTRAVFDVPKNTDFYQFVSRLQSTEAFRTIEIKKMVKQAGDHVRLEVEFTVPIEH